MAIVRDKIKKKEHDRIYREKHRERHNERARIWRKKKKDSLDTYYTEYNSRFRIKRPERYLLQKAKGSAKSRNLEINITEEDIKIPEICPVLGMPLEITAGKGRRPNSPSIDRIDNSLGYIKGNIQVMSWRANNLKSNGTLKEFRSLVRWLEYGKEKTQLS